MKICLSFLQSGYNHPIPAYSFWPYYIKNGIAEAGHTWTEIPDADWALGLVPKPANLQATWKQEIWEKTFTWLKKNPVNLFLSYLYPDQIDVQAIKAIQQLGIPCVNFFCDHVRQYKQVPVEFACFDFNWVPEFQALPMYRKAKYPHLHLPMPVWIEPKDRVIQKEIYPHLTFIGSKDIQRQLLFENIVIKNNHLPLKIYGNGWLEELAANQHLKKRKVTDILINQYQFFKQQGLQAYIRKLDCKNISHVLTKPLQVKVQATTNLADFKLLTAASLVTIGVNRYPSYHHPLQQPDTYSRLRDLEAPMLGACYLTEFTPGLDVLYDLENEVETYTNADTFIEKAEQLIADPNKRILLKVNAQKRALQSHTIPESLKKLIQYLNF